MFPFRIVCHILKGPGTEWAKKQNLCLLLIEIHSRLNCIQQRLNKYALSERHTLFCVCIHIYSSCRFSILKLTSQPEPGRKSFCQCEKSPIQEEIDDTTSYPPYIIMLGKVYQLCFLLLYLTCQKFTSQFNTQFSLMTPKVGITF